VLALRHRDVLAGAVAARPLVLPWESLLLTVLVVPAIALVAAALLTRAPAQRAAAIHVTRALFGITRSDAVSRRIAAG
jgi:hypothetical protein